MTDILNHTTRDFSVKETAQEIRKALRAAFPGTRFSLRMSRGTGYGWMHLDWTDGPRVGQVTPITHGFQSSYFDGMDDGTHQIEPTLYALPDGSLCTPRYSCHGVNWSREFSAETEKWAEAIAVRGSWWWPMGLDAWQDTQYYATRKLLDGLDLSAGFPVDPRAAFVERWQS